MKIVSETPEALVRQRRLEEQVRVSFAGVAANTLEFLAGGQPRADIVDAMREFVAIHDAAEQETTDPKGVPIRIPALGPKQEATPDPDKAINTVLRGALRMVAALLLHNAKTDNEDYDRANREFAEGFTLLDQKIARRR